MIELAKSLSKSVIGQSQAKEALEEAFLKYYYQASPEKGPIATLIFAGPTGTGKTFLCETLAKELKWPFFRIDCAEFQMEHELAKLIGAPPGYLGHDSTIPRLAELAGSSSNDIKSNILLFDEIEKAHPALCDLLLGVMDNGILTLGNGKKINFQHTIIILTSNLGFRTEERNSIHGFSGADATSIRLSNFLSSDKKILASIRSRFRPEFLNRITNIVIFSPLSEEEIGRIVDREIQEIRYVLSHGIPMNLHITEKLRNLVRIQGYSPFYGAREVKRVISRLITIPFLKWWNSLPADAKYSCEDAKGPVFITYDSTQQKTICKHPALEQKSNSAGV